MTRGRSKQMGKSVDELSERELKMEQQRCQNLIRVYGNKIASKGLSKRLYEIEKRLDREFSDE